MVSASRAVLSVLLIRREFHAPRTDGLLPLDDIPLRGGEFVKNGTSSRKEGFAEFG